MFAAVAADAYDTRFRSGDRYAWRHGRGPDRCVDSGRGSHRRQPGHRRRDPGHHQRGRRLQLLGRAARRLYRSGRDAQLSDAGIHRSLGVGQRGGAPELRARNRRAGRRRRGQRLGRPTPSGGQPVGRRSPRRRGDRQPAERDRQRPRARQRDGRRHAPDRGLRSRPARRLRRRLCQQHQRHARRDQRQRPALPAGRAELGDLHEPGHGGRDAHGPGPGGRRNRPRQRPGADHDALGRQRIPRRRGVERPQQRARRPDVGAQQQCVRPAYDPVDQPEPVHDQRRRSDHSEPDVLLRRCGIRTSPSLAGRPSLR